MKQDDLLTVQRQNIPFKRGKTTNDYKIKIKNELNEQSDDTYSEKTDEFMRMSDEE